MQTRKIILFLCIMIFALSFCKKQGLLDKASAANVQVYGRTTCAFTTSTLNNLNTEGINYTFKDIADSSNNSEMWTKLRNSGYTDSSVNLPVVDVSGNIMIRPSISQIKEKL